MQGGWSVAVFAHNEARNIQGCLASVIAQQPAACFPVYVLINGSRDATERLVREFASSNPQVVPIVIALGDKTNAWNTYVHDLAPTVAAHFFVDGDTRPLPGSFEALAVAMRQLSSARAIGALPAAGRDRDGWSRRMMTFGRLAGCLYALSGSYLAELRSANVRMPIGLIGEDLLLSCLVKGRFGMQALLEPSPRLAFAQSAGFWFRSLSPRRPADWVTYARRLVRYRVRDYQLAMLLDFLQGHSVAEMPADSAALYRLMPVLPHYAWRGRSTPIDVLAIRNIRRDCRRG